MNHTINLIQLILNNTKILLCDIGKITTIFIFLSFYLFFSGEIIKKLVCFIFFIYFFETAYRGGFFCHIS